MPTVRDLFLEALAMKVQDISSPKIREHLINKGHDISHSQITEVGNENSYELERIPVMWKRSPHVGSNWRILAD